MQCNTTDMVPVKQVDIVCALTQAVVYGFVSCHDIMLQRNIRQL